MLEYLYTLDYTTDHRPNLADKESTEEKHPDTDDLAPVAGPSSTCDPLSFHILMYSLADRLFIKGLKALATENVERELSQRLNPESFPSAVAEIYNSTPSHDRGLRNVAVEMTTTLLTVLRRTNESGQAVLPNSLLRQVPDYTYDLSVRLIDRNVSMDVYRRV